MHMFIPLSVCVSVWLYYIMIKKKRLSTRGSGEGHGKGWKEWARREEALAHGLERFQFTLAGRHGDRNVCSLSLNVMIRLVA